MTKAKLLVLGLALCLMANVASATPDLFGFSFSNIRATFDGVSSFSTMDWVQTAGDVDRNVAPIQSTYFAGALGTNFFSMSMAITNITATTADGVGGIFWVKDRDGDTITGGVNGHWTTGIGVPTFAGTLSNVMFNQVVNTTFDGDPAADLVLGGGPVSMVFSSPMPWNGTLIELTTSGAWFQNNVPFDVKGGSVDAMVGATAIPAPAALLLGLFGLSAIGLRRRKFT